jgi:hypothetical protein
VVCFKGQKIAALRSAKPFIKDWVFKEDGGHVVIKSRAAHGAAIIELFGIQSASAEAAVDAFARIYLTGLNPSTIDRDQNGYCEFFAFECQAVRDQR